ncbi:gustatory and odorant receptor 21a-like [Rhynchophorus ferrugineus]|uniref:gustatory and odorant receptor 21a-like n=1 Tax=Rhynchophorus ferrugineus TaxID=354439 RepID=UPI003FCD2AC0
MINMNCALWYINCRAIGNASSGVAESFKKDIDSYCTGYIIKHYRILWLELSEILQKLGNAYARTYSTYSLFMMANITISLYGFTSEIVDHGIKFTFKEIGLLVDAIYCIILLYIFCDCSHKASSNIADRVQWYLMEVNLNTVDQSCVKEIQLFLIAIQMNPPKVSLRGYTVVNRELITSVGIIYVHILHKPFY